MLANTVTILREQRRKLADRMRNYFKFPTFAFFDSNAATKKFAGLNAIQSNTVYDNIFLHSRFISF